MSKAIRALTIGGLGLLAGAAIGAPAQAVTSTVDAPARPSVEMTSPYLPSASEVVGFYSTPRGCMRAGWVGEQHHFWDDDACTRVRTGIRRGTWALQIDRDDWNWGVPGFRTFYSGNQFGFRANGFLGYGPRFNNWVLGPLAYSPFGNCDDDGDYPGEDDYDGSAYGSDGPYATGAYAGSNG
jgi:hypothetical protein